MLLDSALWGLTKNKWDMKKVNVWRQKISKFKVYKSHLKKTPIELGEYSSCLPGYENKKIVTQFSLRKRFVHRSIMELRQEELERNYELISY